MKRLEVHSLSVRHEGRTRVDDISLDIAGGTLFGLIGPNGAGKSSLLKAIAQLIPHSGDVVLDSYKLEKVSALWRARRLAYLAQSGEVAWPMNVQDFVMLGRLPHRRDSLSWSRRARQQTAQPNNDDEIVRQALEQTGLWNMSTRYLDQLSGGELARVRLARALAVDAGVLLADEPCASLDPFHQLKVMELLQMQSRQGRVVIVVLHDLTLASRFCDQLLLLHEGQVVANGTPRTVLTPDNLQQVYRVQAIHGEYRDQPYIVPWQSSTPEMPPVITAPASTPDLPKEITFK
ncbi:ABC transporter ATP-binding protein [Granulosicoccus antarcticus]|uniref:Fe(3+) dicitrate transport ATP-binding protein FecE n=1 Tax=Granulosicoccus antarcticus IMCC3135 TaxID=1192854 RepID=A0A2Z2NKI9_9GAMM|nr:ABC transporter ATP-binding protein [Granulosicoccus antarcticus]ASJ71826.1 Fe(3+) dicitrate transport ATP-binding protein FecE [Granulosicoccus antarcticus IMCC3135]